MRLTDNNITENLMQIGLTDIEYDSLIADIVDMILSKVDDVEMFYGKFNEYYGMGYDVTYKLCVKAAAEIVSENFVTRISFSTSYNELRMNLLEKVGCKYDEESEIRRHWENALNYDIIVPMKLPNGFLDVKVGGLTFTNVLNTIGTKTRYLLYNYHANYWDNRWSKIVGRRLNQPYLEGYADHYIF